jgi:hypothetical protein
MPAVQRHHYCIFVLGYQMHLTQASHILCPSRLGVNASHLHGLWCSCANATLEAHMHLAVSPFPN